MDDNKRSIIEIINNYWGMILFMLGIVFHSLWTYFQVGEHKIRLNKLENRADGAEKSMDEIKGDIREIKTGISYIKESVTELKKT